MDEILSVGNEVLKGVLAQANKDQNQHYPPGVFTTHMRFVSSWFKDVLGQQYPNSQVSIDILAPYMDFLLVVVKNGILPFPKSYRNLLGVGFFTNDPKGECLPWFDKSYFADPKNPTADELLTVNAAKVSLSKDFDMCSVGEWNYFSNHPYKSPNRINPKTKRPFYKKAKGCIFNGEGIRVMPFNVPFAEIRFIKKTNPYVYGYKKLPDETYVFDPDATTEELWGENAIPYLIKAVNILFANYLKDKDYQLSAQDLRDNSIF